MSKIIAADHFETQNWEAPVPYSDDDKFYEWDEETLSWVEDVDSDGTQS